MWPNSIAHTLYLWLLPQIRTNIETAQPNNLITTIRVLFVFIPQSDVINNSVENSFIQVPSSPLTQLITLTISVEKTFVRFGLIKFNSKFIIFCFSFRYILTSFSSISFQHCKYFHPFINLISTHLRHIFISSQQKIFFEIYCYYYQNLLFLMQAILEFLKLHLQWILNWTCVIKLFLHWFCYKYLLPFFQIKEHPCYHI